MRVAWLCIPALIGALSCSSGEAPRADDVPVKVRDVVRDAQNQPVVLLGERDGPRWLPIWIGTAEARSIALGLEGLPGPRPNSHDLAQRLVHGLRGSVERVVVTELRDGTYYATITLASNGERIEVDSRPSDAIALALRSSAPIFVRAGLLSDGGGPSDEDPGPRLPI